MFENLGPLVFDIARLTADIATIGTLLFVVLPFMKSIKSSQANALKNAYENQSQQCWTVINNPKALGIVAEAYGVSEDKFIQDTVASDRINAVAWQYEFYKQKLTEPELWQHQILDIQFLFSIPFIAERWKKVQSHYPKDFQQFINHEILIEPSNTQSNEITNSSLHG